MSNHNTDTSGHLGSNGGVRGHSAGDFFPFRVMLQGKLDDLRHWVVSPTGEKIDWYLTTEDACQMARWEHAKWCRI